VVETGKPVEILLVIRCMRTTSWWCRPAHWRNRSTAEKMTPEPDARPALRAGLSQSPFRHQNDRARPTRKLSFTAPEEEGDYPICLHVPRHWRRMVGTPGRDQGHRGLSGDARDGPAATRDRVEIEDLKPDLPKLAAGRSLGTERFFTKLACGQCHKLGKEATIMDRTSAMFSSAIKMIEPKCCAKILEPSLVISKPLRKLPI